jgi:V/A-type H+-transporting ATPase subunit I
MTIARLQRVTLCGITKDKHAFLAALQDSGCMHIVPLREVGPLEPANAGRFRRAYSAYRHINEAPQQLRPWPKDRAVDLSAIVDAALKNKDRLREARDRRDFLVERITGLQPFGDFALPPEDTLRGLKLWFYVLPVKNRAALSKVDLPWQIVGRNRANLYLVVISKEEPPAALLPVPRTHTGSQPLSALLAERESVEIEIEEAEVERAELSRSRVALGLRLTQAEELDDLRAAALMTQDAEPIFAVQGWVPVNDIGRIRSLAEKHGMAVVFEDPRPGDSPPTLLEDPGLFAGCKGLTTFYMTPSYRGWDPSLIVFSSFCIFFAMILVDAGYALVLGGVLALIWRRMGRSAGARQARLLLAIMLGVAFLYGAFAGSWFGVAPPKESLLGSIAFIDATDFKTMMRVSMVVGVLQIALANAEVAWRSRSAPVAIAKAGWIVTLAGGLGVWLAPTTIWYATVAAGLVMVFVGTVAQHAVKRPVDRLLGVAAGALALTQATKLFGDVLSYMRLFALGLASASLAATFNNLGTEIAGGLPGIGLLFAIVVLLFGHTINIALGILDGVVHGLRLNYIEFFGWALSEEGYPFKAFARRRTVT